MPHAHQSFFTYTIGRPWPYRWFTPVVIVGTVAFIVLFSVLNLVSSGYALRVEYTTNPNSTSSNAWFNKWPSFLTSKVTSTCQAVNIPVGSRLVTNNTALTYTLTRVSQQDKAQQDSYTSTLVYRNNLLTGCQIHSMQVHLRSSDRTATQIALKKWGLESKAFTSCSFGTEDGGTTTFNLTANYNLVPDTVSVYDGLTAFIGRNETSAASLYWGESLLSMFWIQSVSVMEEQAPDMGEVYLEQAIVTFTPNTTRDAAFTSLDYFDVMYRIPFNNRTGGHGLYALNNETLGSMIEKDIGPTIWPELEKFVKSMHSTVLADLGQPSTDQQPNILDNATLLGQYTADFFDIAKNETNLRVGPARDSYTVLKDSTGPLGIKPAVLAATYLCSTPHLKPIGELLIAITVANLVLLQAFWNLFTVIMTTVVTHKDPTANHCEGCTRSLSPLISEERHSAATTFTSPLIVVNHKYEKLSGASPEIIQDHDRDHLSRVKQSSMVVSHVEELEEHHDCQPSYQRRGSPYLDPNLYVGGNIPVSRFSASKQRDDGKYSDRGHSRGPSWELGCD